MTEEVEMGKVNTWYVVGHKWNCPWCRRPIQFRYELRYHIWEEHIKKAKEWFER